MVLQDHFTTDLTPELVAAADARDQAVQAKAALAAQQVSLTALSTERDRLQATLAQLATTRTPSEAGAPTEGSADMR